MMNSNAGGSKSISSNSDDTDDLDDIDDLDDSDDLGEIDDMQKTTVLDRSDDLDDDDLDDDDLENTVVLDETDSFSDNVGDVSVEINVEQLLADIEANNNLDAARRREIRRRLEEAVENRSLDDTYAFDMNEQSD
jgi:hypothetical protein